MAMHCETADEIIGKRAWIVQSCLRTDMMQTLTELNDQCLELMTLQARTRTTGLPLLLRDLRELWVTLDGTARRRAATCPYLLVDAGFSDAHRWMQVSKHGARAGAGAPAVSFFTVPQATEVTRLVLIFAWHLARSNDFAARMLLGMSAHCASLVAACTLKQIADVAEAHPDWLRPRWPGRVQVWRELLITAARGDAKEMEKVRMRGLHLLAAETRRLDCS